MISLTIIVQACYCTLKTMKHWLKLNLCQLEILFYGVCVSEPILFLTIYMRRILLIFNFCIHFNKASMLKVLEVPLLKYVTNFE